jgi:hypothetical protein
MMPVDEIVELNCCAQNYDWGIKGTDSLVGQIYQANSGNLIEEDKPYAEVYFNWTENLKDANIF